VLVLKEYIVDDLLKCKKDELFNASLVDDNCK
jgi:hypothetical protein